MSFSRSIGVSPYSSSRQDMRLTIAHEELRRSTRSSQLGAGTLACSRCDAPVAIGAQAVSPTHVISCPFCLHRAPLRDFLSLALPTRPARVVVRVAPGSPR